MNPRLHFLDFYHNAVYRANDSLGYKRERFSSEKATWYKGISTDKKTGDYTNMGLREWFIQTGIYVEPR